MNPSHVIATDLVSFIAHNLDRVGKTLGRAPHPDPAFTKPCGPRQGSVGPPPYQYRNRFPRARLNYGVFDVKFPPSEGN